MTMWLRALGATTVVTALLLTGSGEARARESSRAKAHLTKTGIDADAAGDVEWSIGSGRSVLTIRTRGLDAGSYTVRVGGVPEGELVSKSGRSATARFTNGLRRGTTQALDFDPRGNAIELENERGGVLEVEVSGPGPEPAGTMVEERTSLARMAAAPPQAEAGAHFRLRKDGRTSFEVELSRVPDGAYVLFVDGIERGTIQVKLGRGKVEFDSADSRKLVLDFDPRAATIDVAQGGVIFFSGPLLAQAPGVTVCTPSDARLVLLATAAAAGGHAELRFRTKTDCEKNFEVELEDVAAGAYDLFVNGAVVGAIVAAPDPLTGRIEGEIEFSTDTDDAEDLPLTFDPVNANVEIRLGATLLFSGIADPNSPAPAVCTADETTVLLAAAAGQPGAKGDASLRVRSDCRSSFRVQIEDVTTGTYDLVVGGVVRGTITAALDPVSGEIQGEIEFSNSDDQPGDLPLTFDPAGQTIEVSQGGIVALSSVLGAAPGGGPTSCVETVTEQPLLNVGPDADAKGKARLRLRDDCRKSFRVESEKLADGSYDLVVGGTLEGTIQVTLGVGEIEFDSNDPPKPVLDFDPIGKVVEVRQGNTTYLSRAFGL
jgi:cytochrome c oxidase assembly protein Cox11